MEIKKYISSGILEQYVLGDLDSQQRQEVESYANQYPEIQSEIEAIEDALEYVAQAAAVTPPPGLGLRILDSIEDKDPTPPSAPQESTPSNPARSTVQVPDGEPRSNPFRGLSLLAGILLLGSLIWGYMQYKKGTQHKKALIEMTQNYNLLENDCARLKTNATHIAFLKDANTTPILMAGTDRSPESSATVFWNKEKKKAYLDTERMPSVPSGKQYQLWAIVEGKPVDMGVFDPITDNTILIEIPFIETPQAFAVTLEKEGGNPTPTMEEMHVLGEV